MSLRLSSSSGLFIGNIHYAERIYIRDVFIICFNKIKNVRETWHGESCANDSVMRTLSPSMINDQKAEYGGEYVDKYNILAL